MKRKLVALLLSSCLVGSMFAQEESNIAKEESNGTAVGTTIGGTAKDVCRFSAGIKGGLNYLRVSDQKFQPQFGAFVEATVNPIWGIGLEYMYLMNDRETLKAGAWGELESTVQDITLFGSLNVSNIISKYRSEGWQKLNLYANAGMGVSIFDWKVKDTDKKNDGVQPVVVGGLGLEYNVAKWLALGLDGQYRWHSKAKFTGYNSGRSMAGANISIRFKFGGENNVRNMALVDYEPQVETSSSDNGALEQKIAELEAKVKGEQAAQDAEIQKLQAQVKEVQDTLAAMKDRAKVRAKYIPTTEEAAIIKTAFSQLEFESGSAVIKPASYSSLDGLASLLQQRAGWSVILRGYTDNTGNVDKNLQLSKDRAAAVKTYLVNKGVPASVIETFGHGIENPIATNSTPAGRAQNRRVEIELFSK